MSDSAGICRTGWIDVSVDDAEGVRDFYVEAGAALFQT